MTLPVIFSFDVFATGRSNCKVEKLKSINATSAASVWMFYGVVSFGAPGQYSVSWDITRESVCCDPWSTLMFGL